jgi:hypothetical protein
MKPEQWILDDMKSLRAIENRSPAQEAYLSLLKFYVKMLQGK